jgi:hypothetical protein
MSEQEVHDPVTRLVLRENCIILQLKGGLPSSFLPWLCKKFAKVGLALEVDKPEGLRGENSADKAATSKRDTKAAATHSIELAAQTETTIRVFASGSGESLLFEAERCGLLKPAAHPSYEDHPLQAVSTTPAALAAMLAAADNAPDLHALNLVFSEKQLSQAPRCPTARSLRRFVTHVLSPSDVLLLTSQLLDDAVDSVAHVAIHYDLSQQRVNDLHVASASPTAPHLLRILPALRAAGLVQHESALHVRRHAKAFLGNMVHPSSWWAPQRTVNAVQAYFGDDIGVYFAWVAFSIKAFCVPGLVALALWAHRPQGVTVDTSPYVPLHSLLVIPLWAIAFVRLWQQQASQHAAQWGSLPALQGSARQFEPDTTSMRPQFHGTVRVLAITGKATTHYASWRRALALLHVCGCHWRTPAGGAGSHGVLFELGGVHARPHLPAARAGAV